MEERRFDSRAPSPPPPYSSLFPELEELNSEVSSLRGGSRRNENQDGQQQHRQYFVVDKESFKNLHRNRQKAKTFSETSKLTPINVYGNYRLDNSNRPTMGPPTALVSRQALGTTYVKDNTLDSPNNLEYALLPPISPRKVYDVVRNFYHSHGFEYQPFDIENMRIWYWYQCKLGTICEKRQLKTITRSLQDTAGEENASTNGSQSSFSPWDVDIPMPEDRQPVTCDVPNTLRISPCDNTNKKRSPKCSKCQGRGEIKTHLQITAEWFTYINCHNGPIQGDNKGPKPPKVSQSFLNRCHGLVLLEDAPPGGEVLPISSKDILDQSVVSACNELLTRHKAVSENGKIIKQRQMVLAMPVYQVFCRNRRNFVLWIFGTNHLLNSHNIL